RVTFPSLCLHLLFSFLLFFMLPPPPRSTLFPYTTLFRSLTAATRALGLLPGGVAHAHGQADAVARDVHFHDLDLDDVAGLHHLRSEEHTSELQSRENLVCRLLLEKKKNELKWNTNTSLTC